MQIEPTEKQPHIYQVSFASWSPAVMVIADDIAHALNLALEHRGGDRGAGPVMTWDATDSWLTTNDVMRAHSEAVLARAVCGVAIYDEDAGWLVDCE